MAEIKSTKLYRQGDVLLRQVESLPKDAKKNENTVLARGETTGHSHRIENGKVMRTSSGQLLVLADEKTKLVHEEHGQISLESGIYEVIHQREYSPIEERRVMD